MLISFPIDIVGFRCWLYMLLLTLLPCMCVSLIDLASLFLLKVLSLLIAIIASYVDFIVAYIGEIHFSIDALYYWFYQRFSWRKGQANLSTRVPPG